MDEITEITAEELDQINGGIGPAAVVWAVFEGAAVGAAFYVAIREAMD